jgi:ferredoxin
MPELEVESVGIFEVEVGERLVLAIEEDARVDIMHACGSYSKCSACRVEFLEVEPEDMTEAEMMFLEMRDLLGEARLSCRIYRDHY